MITCVRVQKIGFLVTYHDKKSKRRKVYYNTPVAPDTVFKFIFDPANKCRTANNGDFVYRHNN